MAKTPPTPDLRRRRPLNIPDILRWSAHHKLRTGQWPNLNSGEIIGERGENWHSVDDALRKGTRTLPGRSSLAQLLAERCGVRNRLDSPQLTEEQILNWADAYHSRHGSWPKATSGVVPEANGENWSAINLALRVGVRGLSGGSSLARLLEHRRGVRNRATLPPLTIELILSWSDLFFEKHGRWPYVLAGEIEEAPGEMWHGIDAALIKGLRGLPGGTSLAKVLAEHRNAFNPRGQPTLSVEQILIWSDAYHQRVGKWPTAQSGPIDESLGESWSRVDSALKVGSRGLPGGSSLARLLAKERDVRNPSAPPRLTRKQILIWADEHRRRTGELPLRNSGPVVGVDGETWAGIDRAMIVGNRGFRPGSSLANLLAAHRGKRNTQNQPRLSKKRILIWADEHFQTTGRWPTGASGKVLSAPHENWKLIDFALREGRRGLPKGSSLVRLFARKRGARNRFDLPPLTVEQILKWATDFQQQSGRWPKEKDGTIVGTNGETWSTVDDALRFGKRGLPTKSSLAKLLAAVESGAEKQIRIEKV